MTIGERIALARKRVHLTQAELGKQTETHANTISRWEKDERTPDAEVLGRMAAIMKVSPTWLISGDGPMATHKGTVRIFPPGTEDTGDRTAITGAGSSFQFGQAQSGEGTVDPAHAVTNQALFNLTRELSPEELPAFLAAATAAVQEARRARQLAKGTDKK